MKHLSRVFIKYVTKRAKRDCRIAAVPKVFFNYAGITKLAMSPLMNALIAAMSRAVIML